MINMGRAGLLVCGAVLLAGCAAGSIPTSRPPENTSPAAASPVSVSSPAAGRATIAGGFAQEGGMAPGTALSPIPGRVSAYTRADGSGTPVASTQTDSEGHFSLQLAPGTYYLFGIDPNLYGPGPDNGHRVSYDKPVRVVAGTTSRIDFRVFVP